MAHLGITHHGQHPFHRSAWIENCCRGHLGPCRLLCIEKSDPWDHRSRCHKHLVLDAEVEIILRRSLTRRRWMGHGTTTPEFHTLDREVESKSRERTLNALTGSSCKYDKY